jgi:xylulokinase/glycerol kinase
VIRYDNSEASSLGALMSASVTLGIHRDHAAAFLAVCGSDPIVFQPGETNVAKYRALLQRKNTLYQALNQNKVYESFCQPV